MESFSGSVSLGNADCQPGWCLVIWRGPEVMAEPSFSSDLCRRAGFEPQPESLEPRRRTGPVSPCLAIKLYLKKKGEAHIVSLPHSPPPHQPRGFPHKSYSPRGPSAPGAWVTLRLQETHFSTVNCTRLPYVCVLSSRPFLQEYSMCSILHSTGVCTCI